MNMSDELDQSDAVEEQQEVSSEPTESSEGESQDSTQTEQQETRSQPQPVPFHEDPKVQDYIQRQTEKQMRELQRTYDMQLQQLKSQFEQQSRPTQTKEDALLARLKGIDPEFGDRFAKLDTAAQKLEQFEQWQKQQEARQSYDRAMNEVSRLHSENNVPDELKPFYNARIQELASSDPSLSLNDLPEIYKQVHDQFVDVVNTIRREERSSYVTEKQKVAKAPTSQAKGQPVTPGKKPQFSKDPVEARNQLIQRVLKTARSENDI